MRRPRRSRAWCGSKINGPKDSVCGCAIAEGRALYASTASSARASWRSAVSKPSVNQP
jgi:hypothetical protein